MKNQIEILKKIQELTLTMAECRAQGDDVHVEELSRKIAALSAKLDPRIRLLYQRLSATKPLFMAAMHNGNCSGCGMQVPVAAVRMVRIGEHPVTCTTCGRLLYEDAGTVAVAPVRPAASGDDDVVPKVRGIARFSSEALMVPNLSAKTAKAC